MAALILREFRPDPDLLRIARRPPAEVEKRAPNNLKLYALGASICSIRARMTIEEKQLAYTEHTLNMAVSENLEPWYLAINPRGVAPAIVEDGRALFDSFTIMLYVNNVFEGPALAPADEEERRDMIDLMSRADLFPIRDFAYRHELDREAPDVWRVAMYERVISYKEKYPELSDIYDRKLEDYASMRDAALDLDAMQRLEQTLESVMDELDHKLAGRRWLAGDSFSLADISWLPILVRLQLDIGREIFGDGLRPNLERLVNECMNRSTFASAIEDHKNDISDHISMMGGQAVR